VDPPVAAYLEMSGQDGGEDMSQSERDTSIGMLCPICRVDLVMAERQNIEIDYCPKCRGVWLDRGELDKIIEKSLAEMRGQPADGANGIFAELGRDGGGDRPAADA
jgi:uncharacterized protein